MQADNYFKVRSGSDSLEFPFVTDYATDAARAEADAREAAAEIDGSIVSVYDAEHFPDYPQVGDWSENDLRASDDVEEDDNGVTFH